MPVYVFGYSVTCYVHSHVQCTCIIEKHPTGYGSIGTYTLHHKGIAGLYIMHHMLGIEVGLKNYVMSWTTFQKASILSLLMVQSSIYTIQSAESNSTQ